MENMPDQPNSVPEQQADWFENLLTQYEHQQPQAGQIIQATVIRVDKEGILVDVGIKRDALIPVKDYPRVSQTYLSALSPGDEIPVYVVGQSEENGELQLSLSKGLENQVWEKAEQAMKDGAVLELDVLGHNRGGLIVRFESLRGFLPFSLVPELQGVRSPKRADEIKNSLVGKPIPVKVTEVDRAKNRLILSAEAAQKEKLQERLLELKKGQVLTGKVVKILDFGVFVDLGGVDGLVHLSQLSWKKARPADLVKIGDEIEVKVLDVDVERKRISLSRKALMPGPWQTIGEELKQGDYIEGIVTRLVDFGAFVKLPMGVEGLIHTSQIGYSSGQNTQGVIKPGDKVLLKVLDVNPERKRVALSMRQVPLERQIAWAMENIDTDMGADEETAVVEAPAAEAQEEAAPAAEHELPAELEPEDKQAEPEATEAALPEESPEEAPLPPDASDENS
jgi:small subunit ribosomal protein S1